MFRPESPPASLDRSVGGWLSRQFELIRRTANDALDYVYLRKTTQAPQRNVNGELRWADGENWDPRGRATGTAKYRALYLYDSKDGQWQQLLSIGAGASVTQPTDKTTAVTINAPTGQITTNNAALAAGASVVFAANNSLIGGDSIVLASMVWGAADPANYSIRWGVGTGVIRFILKNESAGSLSEAVIINFTVIPSCTT